MTASFSAREVRFCTPKAACTDRDLRSVTAFVVFEEFGATPYIPGDYPSNEPETVSSDKPIRCYKNRSGTANVATDLIFVRDLSDAEFQRLFTYTDATGV